MCTGPTGFGSPCSSLTDGPAFSSIQCRKPVGKAESLFTEETQNPEQANSSHSLKCQMRIGRHEKEKRQERRREEGRRREERRRRGEEERKGKHCLDMCNNFWSTWYAVHIRGKTCMGAARPCPNGQNFSTPIHFLRKNGEIASLH